MTEKTIKQQIATAQERLYFLESKKKKDDRKLNTRQKIILGAEVAKILGCDISQVDKKLVFGILLDIYSLHENDIENYRERGQIYLDTIINKSKS
ncbi:conjugal transfer protein TraD [Yersinia enterocolitica]|uniref:conjugal transfer protein TraD n=1 Tax=Yersinia enterocolitica TaxID=630 RepID=UPI000281938C|nr:conjugal transfer protein TraD [Yersinia enterocolitica]AJI84703.1 conjugal transfer TraD family protein [Yersinia enterocolitica]EKA26852.1 conjugal transfer protein TraD [Yersinia enterocolitica subsp. enterocolitica WA-314]KGA70785.1 conjugal transfer TraD family protein [Yersinia enterocolitica]PNM13698.1 conjugal transfer protein TraD [Yersinia enterocolitica]CNK36162.1 putative transcriptional regulator [Yersinia enterocolitica]